MKSQLWNEFCRNQHIKDSVIPLFEADGSVVQTKEIGSKHKRKVLVRSSQMEEAILKETDKLVEDYQTGANLYDGLIYIMYRRDVSTVVPLYIGKAETIGKSTNLSANIMNIHRDKSKFARWGDNYAYHIGDLSAATLPGHSQEKVSNKYSKWAEALFSSHPSYEPQLRTPVFFWCKAWSDVDVGIWREFGPTKLTFLEYLLIGVTSSLFPNDLLNTEGVNRI